MMKKIGINTTRTQKAGPNVKGGITMKRHTRVVTCSCGCKLEKSCENEYICEITETVCPKCGKKVC